MATSTVELIVDAAKALNPLKQVDRATKKLSQAVKKTQGSLRQLEKRAVSMGTSMKKAFARAASGARALSQKFSGLRGAFLSLGVAALTKQLVGQAAEFNQTQIRLKALSKEYGEFNDIQKLVSDNAKIFNQSQAESASNFSDAYARLRPLGVSLAEIQTVYQGFNATAIASGTSAAAASGAFLQLSQALGSGRLQGDEFRSIAEQVPGILRLVSDEMNVTVGELKQLGSEGKITSDILIKALAKGFDLNKNKIQEILAQSPAQQFKAFSNAVTDLGNAVGTELLPAITPAVKNTTDLIAAFGALPKPVILLTAAIVGLGAAVAIALGPIAALVSIFTGPTVLAFAAAVGPFVALAAGIAGVGVAAAVASKKIQDYNDIVDITGNTVNELEAEYKEAKDAQEALTPAIERGGRAAAVAKKKYKELAEALEEIEQRRKVLEQTFNIGGIQYEFTESGLAPIDPPKTVSEEREDERKSKEQRDKEAAAQAKLFAARRKAAQAAALRDTKVLRDRATLNTALTDQEREMLQLQIDIADVESQRALLGDDIVNDKIEALRVDFAQRNVQRALADAQERAAQRITDGTAQEDALRPLKDQIRLLKGKLAGNEEEVRLQLKIEEIRRSVNSLNEDDIKALLQKKKGLEDQVRATEELEAQMKQVGDAIKNNVTNAIMDAIEGTKSLGESAIDVLKQLGRQFLTLGIDQAFSGLGSTGGILGKLFGGGKASGGTVQGGRSYMVGERGPELFTPNRTGSIAPSGSFGGANVTVNVDASGSSVEGNAEQASQLGKAIGIAVQQELIKQKRPGGLLTV